VVRAPSIGWGVLTELRNRGVERAHRRGVDAKIAGQFDALAAVTSTKKASSLGCRRQSLRECHKRRSCLVSVGDRDD
jgi:hypothetical protein